MARGGNTGAGTAKARGGHGCGLVPAQVKSQVGRNGGPRRYIGTRSSTIGPDKRSDMSHPNQLARSCQSWWM
eukprot:scaffold15267_cov118-Isochrysis_galbana.AAC.4